MVFLLVVTAQHNKEAADAVASLSCTKTSEVPGQVREEPTSTDPQ